MNCLPLHWARREQSRTGERREQNREKDKNYVGLERKRQRHKTRHPESDRTGCVVGVL